MYYLYLCIFYYTIIYVFFIILYSLVCILSNSRHVNFAPLSTVWPPAPFEKITIEFSPTLSTCLMSTFVDMSTKFLLPRTTF